MALTKCKDCGNEVSKKADKCPKCGAPIKKGVTFFQSVLFIGAVIGTLVVINKINDPETDAIKNKISVTANLKKDGLGLGLKGTLLIKNDSAKDIKDFTVSCDYIAKSGTKIDSSEREFFEIVKAGQSVKINASMAMIVDDQVSTYNCKVTNFKII